MSTSTGEKSGDVSGGGGSGSSILLNQPIVIDNGTGTIKAGFAGGSKPKVVIGTKVGRTKHMRIMPGGALEQDITSEGGSGGKISSSFVGQKLDDHRGAFLLEYPMDKGCVVDGGWEAMEHIWEHIYSETNLNAKADEHPILLTETPLNPKSNRNKMSEIFFETFRTPALFYSPPSILSLYASGRTTGVVLDVGEGCTHCVPVYEGHALKHSIIRSDLAGRDVTNELLLQLRKSVGLNLSTTAEHDLCKTMKENVCYVSSQNITTTTTDVATTTTIDDKDSATQYQLPDGSTVSLSSERYMSPEILFNPSLIGSEELAVGDVLNKSIQKSDIDLRSTLYSQIVLAGGSTLIPGFGERLLHDVRASCPSHTRIRISAPPERSYSQYVGGSILASLSTFKNMWVTKSEYEEYGTSVLHRNSL